MYAIICTRLDVSYAFSMTKRYQVDPSDGHWTTMKGILMYLRRTKDTFLVFGVDRELVVKGYEDTSFMTDIDDTRSWYGYVFFQMENTVSWNSSMQETVADYTTESKYIAVAYAAKEAVWIKGFISFLGGLPSVVDPVEKYCDNKGAVILAYEPRSH